MSLGINYIKLAHKISSLSPIYKFSQDFIKLLKMPKLDQEQTKNWKIGTK